MVKVYVHFIAQGYHINGTLISYLSKCLSYLYCREELRPVAEKNFFFLVELFHEHFACVKFDKTIGSRLEHEKYGIRVFNSHLQQSRQMDQGLIGRLGRQINTHTHTHTHTHEHMPVCNLRIYLNLPIRTSKLIVDLPISHINHQSF